MSSSTASAPAHPHPAVKHAPLWALGLVTFSGTLAMHIFVPALPLAAKDLNSSPALMQMTISIYILGLAFGQLIYGPLADRYGRRPVLMAGLVIYTVAGLASALAPDAKTLVIARLFQALGGCAGLALARVIARDTALEHEAARRLALMNLMVVLGPGVAPMIGGAIASTLGWRWVLASLCLLGMVNFVCTWKLIHETGRPSGKMDAKALAGGYGRLLVSPAFLGYALGGGCATTAMYAYVATAPFLFGGELHREPHEVGLYLSLLLAGMWVGNMMASRLLPRRSTPEGMAKMMIRANGLSMVMACVFLAAALLHWLSVPLVVGAMFIYTIGAGLASPAALTSALGVSPRLAGSASGLYGCIQMGIGALCTVLGGIGDDPALAASLTLVGAGVVSQVGFWVAARETKRQAALRHHQHRASTHADFAVSDF